MSTDALPPTAPPPTEPPPTPSPPAAPPQASRHNKRSTTYKLTTFNNTGKGEVARYMMKMKHIMFTDVRMTKEEWPKFKAKTPFMQLPILETDGKLISHCRAVERLIAKRTGLYGDGDLEQARADMIIAYADDVYKEMFKIFLADTPDDKAEMKRKLIVETLPVMFANLEKLVNKDGLYINKKIMWPDIAIAHCQSFLKALEIDFDIRPFSKLTALRRMVEADPMIAKYMTARPKLNF